MNIKFSEIEDDQNNNLYRYDQNNNRFNIQEQNKVVTPTFYQPYYENKNTNSNKLFYNSSGENLKKEKITFDDILNNMNMKVIDGSLKLTADVNNDTDVNVKKPSRFEPFNFNANANANTNTNTNTNTNANANTNTNANANTNTNTNANTKKVKFQESVVTPEVKNSWIFNKYFKDYRAPDIEEEPEMPLTREELQQKIIVDHIERIKARQRIAQIKPKQMMFSNNNTMIQHIQTSQNNSQMNKLFRF